MRQVRLLGQLGLLRPLGRLGPVGRGEMPSPNWSATVCGFCHNGLNRHNRLSIAGQARPAVLEEVPCA